MSRPSLKHVLAYAAPVAAALGVSGFPASQSFANTGTQAQAAAPDGARLYQRKCAICHDKGGSGTFMLERRPGMTEPVLAQRTDLRANFVKTVVRGGMVNMPALTKVELPDADLDAIANYLQSGQGRTK